MASLTIRDLDDGITQKLRLRAAEHGRSIEEEARTIINASVDPQPQRRREVPLEREERVRKILSLGRKLDEPFDQKALTDELWNFVE